MEALSFGSGSVSGFYLNDTPWEDVRPINADKSFGFDTHCIIELPGVTGLKANHLLLFPAHALKNHAVQKFCEPYKCLKNFYNDPENAYDLVIFDTSVQGSNPLASDPFLTSIDGPTDQVLLIKKDNEICEYAIHSGSLDAFNAPTSRGFSGGIFATPDIFTNHYYVSGMHVGEGRIISTEKLNTLINIALEKEVSLSHLFTAQLQWIGTYDEQHLNSENVVSKKPLDNNTWYKNSPLQQLVSINARKVFSDHTLFGFNNDEAPCTFSHQMHGRHIAVNLDHARDIYSAFGQQAKDKLSVIYFLENQLKETNFEKISSFINELKFYNKPDHKTFMQRFGYQGLEYINLSTNKNNVKEFHIICKFGLMFFRKTTRIAIFDKSIKKEAVVGARHKLIDLIFSSVPVNNKNDLPFVISHFKTLHGEPKKHEYFSDIYSLTKSNKKK